jgi:hypothetical protein
MTRIVLDAATRARLTGVIDCAELCDESGRSLGHFIPAVDSAWYREIEVPFTNEELDAAEQESEVYTTAEVLHHLNQLKPGNCA